MLPGPLKGVKPKGTKNSTKKRKKVGKYFENAYWFLWHNLLEKIGIIRLSYLDIKCILVFFWHNLICRKLALVAYPISISNKLNIDRSYYISSCCSFYLTTSILTYLFNLYLEKITIFKQYINPQNSLLTIILRK